MSSKPVTQEAPWTFPAVTVYAPLIAGIVIDLSHSGKDREAGVALFFSTGAGIRMNH